MKVNLWSSRVKGLLTYIVTLRHCDKPSYRGAPLLKSIQFELIINPYNNPHGFSCSICSSKIYPPCCKILYHRSLWKAEFSGNMPPKMQDFCGRTVVGPFIFMGYPFRRLLKFLWRRVKLRGKHQVGGGATTQPPLPHPLTPRNIHPGTQGFQLK